MSTLLPHGKFICSSNDAGKRWSYEFDGSTGTFTCALIDIGFSGWSATYRRGVVITGKGGTLICEANHEWGSSDDGAEAEKSCAVVRIFETVILDGRVTSIVDPEHTTTYMLEKLD